jgi:hypothetical protein
VKHKITVLSLLVILLGGVVLFSGKILTAQPQVKNSPNTSAAPPATAVKTKPPTARKVMAYYFHTNYRCWTCRTIEALTQESIQKNFAQELKSGRLEWRVINIDEPANRHFAQDYKLYTKSVIIADLQNGKQVRWKNLEKVWEYVHDPNAFANYIRDEISAYLRGS